MSKFTHIEVGNKTYPVEHAFVHAIIPIDMNKKYPGRFQGLNMAIVLSCNDNGYHEIYEYNFVNCFDVVLCDDLGLKIPIEIHAGNKYSDHDYGYDKKTCCIFGYISPDLFDDRNDGRKSVSLAEFGSYVMGI